MTNHKCPICNIEFEFTARYPKCVCKDCYKLAAGKDGRKLSFYNLNLSGGCEAIYQDTKKIYDSHICYINGIECFADEARFGGIVIEVK